MNPKERDKTIITQQSIRKYWVDTKRKHQQMLKGMLDTSIEGQDSIGCVVDLNITENGRNETKIKEREIVC